MNRKPITFILNLFLSYRMKRLLVIPFIVSLTSCSDFPENTYDFYQQFNYNDLQYLITDKDSFYNVGDDKSFDYPLRYLANGKDTINVTAKTEFRNRGVPEDAFWTIYDEFCGTSTIYTNQNTDINFLEVRIKQDTIYDATDKRFTVHRSNTGYSVYFEFLGNAANSIPMDTADIRGTIYQSVHKFYVDSLDRVLTKIKSFYFAKSVGFIRVETVDGKTLELLKGGSANRQYPNQW